MALKIAARSAQVPARVLASSTLTPKNSLPSFVTTQAETGKLEIGT